MTAASVRASVDIAAPIERVFPAMVELASQDRWILLTRLYALDGAAPVPEVGSRMAALTGVLGFGVLDTMQVTVYEPLSRWETAHDGGLIKGRGIFAVERTPDGTRASWIEELDLPLGAVGRAGWLLVRPLVKLGLAASLRRLAAGVLDGSLPPPPK